MRRPLTGALAVTLALLFPVVGALMVGGGIKRTSVVLAVPAVHRLEVEMSVADLIYLPPAVALVTGAVVVRHLVLRRKAGAR